VVSPFNADAHLQIEAVESLCSQGLSARPLKLWNIAARRREVHYGRSAAQLPSDGFSKSLASLGRSS
jgi:hypothetical protein